MRSFEEMLKEYEEQNEVKYTTLSEATARIWYTLGQIEALKDQVEKLEGEFNIVPKTD